MRVNFGYFVNKFIKIIYRSALRDCEIDKTASIGMASNCIRVRMGRYSYIGNNNSICDTTIGSFCSIASYCAIGGGKHPLNTVSTSPVFYEGRNIIRKNYSSSPRVKNEGVIIGNDVWIGEAVFINDGLKIGTGAVVGAHSVVTKDVPPYAVAVGAPAKVIKYRFDEETIERLLESKWWEWSEEKIVDRAQSFSKVEDFLLYK